MKYTPVDLFYDNLHVEFDYGPMDWETGRGTKEFEREIEYTYEADKDDVIDVILNLIPEEEYDEIVKENSNFFDHKREEDIVGDYIEANFDKFFDRFEDKILKYFRPEAEDDARRKIDPEDYIYEDVNMRNNRTAKKLREDFDPFTDIIWDPDLIDKFEFLQDHKTYDGQFSRDVKMWDLDLTPEQEEYYGDFIYHGGLMRFWEDQKEYSKDIFQAGRQGGHLILGGDADPRTQPSYYDANLFTGDLTDCFAEWVLDNEGVYLEYYETEEELNEVKERFIEWLNEAYEAVEDFDERVDHLIAFFKEALDDYIEKVSKKPKNEGLEMNESANNNWDKALQDKFNFLKNHKTHEGKFSRDVKVWDLGLTDKQEDYFYKFVENGMRWDFWQTHKELTKDIYQEGRQGGHLVLDVDYGEFPLEYDPFNFKVDDLDEAFELWCNNTYGLNTDEYAYTDEEMADLRDEFIDWVGDVYLIVTDFDERTEKLVELFKEALDKFIEQEEAPSEDLTKTMFSEVEDIEEPELEGPKYDEINESYFDEDEEDDEAPGWDDVDYDEDDFDECYNGASNELPEIKENLDYNPDFDDDFAGRRTSYDIYKAQQELDDEEAFEDRDPNRYDDKHAKEWMKKHPHGWYNSESDYGVGDEDFDESWNPYDEEDDEGEPFEPYFVAVTKYNKWIETFDYLEDAIEFAKENPEAVKIKKFDIDNFDEVVWTKKEDGLGEAKQKVREDYFDYNKYKLPRDVVKFIKETAEKDIKERLRFSDEDWSTMDSQDTSDWVMDRIEIKFPGWKWTDENMSYVETVVDDIFDDMRKKSFNEEVEDDYNYESYYSIRDKHGWAIGAEDDKKTAIKHAQNDPRAEKVVFINLPNKAKVVWQRKKNDINEELSKSDKDELFVIRDESFPMITDREVEKLSHRVTAEDIQNGHVYDIFQAYYNRLHLNWGRRDLEEGAMSDLDLDIQETGYDEMVDKIQRNIEDLEKEEKFLINQAPREIGRGGNFDSQSEIDDALRATQRELNRERAKLAIVRGKQNG